MGLQTGKTSSLPSLPILKTLSQVPETIRQGQEVVYIVHRDPVGDSVQPLLVKDLDQIKKKKKKTYCRVKYKKPVEELDMFI